MAARPRTLPAAVAPVLVGTALAATGGTFKVAHVPRRAASARCSSRSGRTSPTTTPTRAAAPTPRTGSGPVRVTAGGLVPPRQVLIATYVAFGVAVLAGVYLIATAGWELLLVGAASILAGVLYTGGPRPVRLRGARRGLRVPVLRRRRRRRLLLRADRGARRGRRSCWPCRSGCSPARSSSSTTCATSRPTGGRASARSPCGSAASARADAVRGDDRRRVPSARRCRGCSARCRRGCCCAGWRSRSPCRVVADRADAHRRAGAQRRARRHGAAAARVLRAAVGRAAGLAERGAARGHAGAARAAGAAADGVGRAGASASCCRSGWRGRDGDFGLGEAAPLEPYDGVPLGAVRGGARRLRARCCATPARAPSHAELLAACAAERDLPAGARGDRPRAVGPRRAARRAAGRAPARRGRGGARARSTRRSAPRTARARRRRPRPRRPPGFGCVKVKVGIGDDAGRVAAVRAAVGPDVAIRVDANGAWADAGEALANLRALAPAGLEYAEEPVHGVEALRAVRAAGVVRGRDGRDRGRAGRGRLGRRRRGLPQDRPLRRDHRRAARRARRRGRPARRSTSRRRSTGRSASPPACTWRRRCGRVRVVRAGDARARSPGYERRARAGARRDRGADRPRPARAP